MMNVLRVIRSRNCGFTVRRNWSNSQLFKIATKQKNTRVRTKMTEQNKYALSKPTLCLLLSWGCCWRCSHRSADMVCNAQEHGQRQDNRARSEKFLEACRDGNLPFVKMVIADGQDVDVRHKHGWTGLMLAAVNGRLSVARYLLESGANPDLMDCYDPYKSTSVYFTSYRDMWDTRRHEFSDYIDETSQHVGCTALHYAATMNHAKIIGLLYEYGVDGTITNKDGHTAKHIATSFTKEVLIACETKQKEKRCAEAFYKVSLRDILRNHLIGQSLAADEISNVIMRLENGWTNEKHPLVLLFVGATGLGKTETAKLLAKYLRGDAKDSFLHINLSEYNTEHEASKFIGAPPGYAGYDKTGEGQLFTVLNKNSRAVVLFDEADKAHPNVLTTLLQLFDEGRLTSGSGKTVECNEALFILTANLAVDEICEFGEELRKQYKDVEAAAAGEETTTKVCKHEFVRGFKEALLHRPLKEAFKRDELLGRVNELAIFIPFSLTERKQIIEHELCRLRKLAAARHGVTLSWQRAVLGTLDASYNEKYGVRNIKYEIDRQIVSKLSQAQEAGLFKAGDFLHIEVGEADPPPRDGKTTSGSARRLIHLAKLSPLGDREHLDSQFEDLTEVYRVVRC